MDFATIWASSPELYSSESSSSSSSASVVPSGDQEVRLASDNPKKVSGRKKFTETRHPVYRGIRRKNSGRWVCELREPAKQMRIWLGTFPTAEMAARAYDVAAIALRGKSALVNFADSASRMRIPETTDPKVIQKAAAAGAEAFRAPGCERHVPSVVISNMEPETEIFPDVYESPFVYSNGMSGITASLGFESENYFYMGEEEEMAFGMPGGLLQDMAGGMMLPMPDCVVPGGFEVDSDVGLWDY